MVRKGFLLVLMDPPAAFDEEFNAWYDTENVPQRMAVPGFETGRRYVCIAGSPRYLAMYDMTTPQIVGTEPYLAVSLDRSSPWTKRVTSRVRVYRSTGAQVYPGDVLTVRCARVALLRFRAFDTRAQPQIVAGMRAAFEGRPETIQVRVFAHTTEAGVDFLGFVEARAPLAEPLDPRAFGKHADALDLINTYAAY